MFFVNEKNRIMKNGSRDRPNKTNIKMSMGKGVRLTISMNIPMLSAPKQITFIALCLAYAWTMYKSNRNIFPPGVHSYRKIHRFVPLDELNCSPWAAIVLDGLRNWQKRAIAYNRYVVKVRLYLPAQTVHGGTEEKGKKLKWN